MARSPSSRYLLRADIIDWNSNLLQVVQSIPNAIGALCLNQVGQEQLAARPGMIPGLFSIFTSEKHQRMLQEKENAVIIGTAVEELVRHHPTLKNQVFEAIKSTMSKIEELGNAYVLPEEYKHWYMLRPTKTTSILPAVDNDVDMEAGTSQAGSPTPALEQPEPVPHPMDDNSFKAHDNVIVSFIDVFGKVGDSIKQLLRLLILLFSSWRVTSNTHPIVVTSSPVRMVSIDSRGLQRSLVFLTTLRIA